MINKLKFLINPRKMLKTNEAWVAKNRIEWMLINSNEEDLPYFKYPQYTFGVRPISTFYANPEWVIKNHGYWLMEFMPYTFYRSHPAQVVKLYPEWVSRHVGEQNV